MAQENFNLQQILETFKIDETNSAASTGTQWFGREGEVIKLCISGRRQRNC